jgi:hypothetical protein
MTFNIAYIIVAFFLAVTIVARFRYPRAHGFFIAALLAFGVMGIVSIFVRH